jgi:hypothetical protein
MFLIQKAALLSRSTAIAVIFVTLGLTALTPAVRADETRSESSLNADVSGQDVFGQNDALQESPVPVTDAPAPNNVLLDPLLVSDSPETMDQVTSVSQLSDVQPTDWAFQAVQSLVERYGCIAGYPDGTFRGSRSATRYELAAALNACLDNISDKFATKEDLEAVKALQEEFAAELATIRGRVDSLEARTSTLEAQQFSTTTKLNAEAIFTVGYAADEEFGAGNTASEERVFFGNRLRLNLDTSFTGKDRLRVRLQARDIPNLADNTGTNMARLSYDGDNNNVFELDDLYYRFPIGDKAKVTIVANSGEFNDLVGTTFNPYLESSGKGAISRFGRFNPIYRQGDVGASGGAGIVVNYKFNDQFAVSAGYLGDQPQNAVGGGENVATPRGGLFGGSYTALGQLEITPSKNLGFGLTYAHTFDERGDSVAVPAISTSVDVTGGTGSAIARRPFGGNVDTAADHFGFQVNAKVTNWLHLSGWAGYTIARNATNGNNDKADIINWAAVFAFPDLGGEGNLGAFVVGQQPRVIDSRIGGVNDALVDGNTNNFHLEGLYRIQISDNISLTPGVIVILNPENFSAGGNPVVAAPGGRTDDPVIIPVVRSTFTF